MIKLILAFFVLAGFNFGFWFIVGLMRYCTERIFPRVLKKKTLRDIPSEEWTVCPHEVAAMVPAHNEEQSIADTINALKAILPAENIYIGSDASTDRTVEVGRLLRVNVIDIRPNRGKARVLMYLLRGLYLADRYKAVMIVDADAVVDKNYLKRALPLFNDPDIVAIAGHGVTRWPTRHRFSWQNFFLAYRMRLWRVVQFGMRYGQTWKYTNVTYIVPGSPSMYRTSAIRHLQIDAPGLVIEDFNMTFELHHKKLGKIGYDPGVFGAHHDPYTFHDYVKQLERWNLGFWQTFKRHGVWLSPFSLSTLLFSIELYMFSIFILFVPLMLWMFFFNGFSPIHIPILIKGSLSYPFTFSDFIVGIFVTDYALTIIAVLFEKKPALLVYGLGFFFLRFVDAFIFVYSFPLAFIKKSDGRWASPTRARLSATT